MDARTAHPQLCDYARELTDYTTRLYQQALTAMEEKGLQDVRQAPRGSSRISAAPSKTTRNYNGATGRAYF